ncbi:MAG: hypothetical protein AAF236_11265 [Verrucomicrobiota bacterium]
MENHTFFLSAIFIAAALTLTSCVEDGSTTGQSIAQTGGAARGGSNPERPAKPREKLSQHDAALRFLTAYIYLNREMALQYATPKAVDKLDWNVPHGGNIPYYDDKMILYFKGGHAKVYFQEVNGSFMISDLAVLRNR